MSIDLEKEYKEFEKNYIDYFNDLENDFLSIKQFVAFEKDNYDTYSVKFLKLYLAVCGEIDNLGKKMAVDINPSLDINSLKNIHLWFYEIQNTYFINKDGNNIALKDFECDFIDETFKPWNNYVVNMNSNNVVGQNTPQWWKEYNDVKHKRMITDDNGILNYKKANMKNVITSFSALYALILAYCNKYQNTKGFRRKMLKSNIFEKVTIMLKEDIDEIMDTILI